MGHSKPAISVLLPTLTLISFLPALRRQGFGFFVKTNELCLESFGWATCERLNLQKPTKQ